MVTVSSLIGSCEPSLRRTATGSCPNGNGRSLYDCFHARVNGKRIYCGKGHRLCEAPNGNGSISMDRLAKGNPLVMGVCRECAEFTSMGEPLLPEEKGWLKIEINREHTERLTWRKNLVN